MGGAMRLPGRQPALRWRTAFSAVKQVRTGSYLGYCPADTDCAERSTVPSAHKESEGGVESGEGFRWTAVLPVGFAEFHGKSVRLVKDGTELPVLSIGASTTVVLLPLDGGHASVGEEVDLCSPCTAEEVPMPIPRILVGDPSLLC